MRDWNASADGASNAAKERKKALPQPHIFEHARGARRIQQREAVHLRGVEDVRYTGDTALAVVVGTVGISLGLGLVLLVKDDKGRFLALENPCNITQPRKSAKCWKENGKTQYSERKFHSAEA